MDLPTNQFKRALGSRQLQLGMFVTIPDATIAEICATVGFDWVLLDAEHGTSDPATVLTQVRAVQARGVSTLVRAPSNDPTAMKPYLDAGVQTLVVPMVDTPEEAKAAAEAVAYPPEGVRGVATTRAAAWGNVARYYTRARQELCLVVQIESRQALDNLEKIIRVDGVDAVFVGPSDLAASLGHLGEPSHPEVVGAVTTCIRGASAAGVPVGVFAASPALARKYRQEGAAFIACGLDAVMVTAALRDVVSQHRQA